MIWKRDDYYDPIELRVAVLIAVVAVGIVLACAAIAAIAALIAVLAVAAFIVWLVIGTAKAVIALGKGFIARFKRAA